MATVIQEEEESFQKLIAAVKPENLSDPEAQTSSATDKGENYKWRADFAPVHLHLELKDVLEINKVYWSWGFYGNLYENINILHVPYVQQT